MCVCVYVCIIQVKVVGIERPPIQGVVAMTMAMMKMKMKMMMVVDDYAVITAASGVVWRRSMYSSSM